MSNESVKLHFAPRESSRDAETLALAEGLAALEQQADLARDAHDEGLESAPSSGDAAPFDLEVARPRAISLRKLFALTDRAVPPEIAATLGAREPVLLLHAITPFHPRLERPRPLWGLGYKASLVEGEAETIAVAPSGEYLSVGSVDQKVRFGLSFGGNVNLAPPGADLLPARELDLPGASIAASTDQKFALTLSLQLELLKVQAGAVGAGGARWNLYRQDERLDRCHVLAQTLLVARGTRRLVYEIETWARTSGYFLGLGAVSWEPQPIRYEVSLDGLWE